MEFTSAARLFVLGFFPADLPIFKQGGFFFPPFPAVEREILLHSRADDIVLYFFPKGDDFINQIVVLVYLLLNFSIIRDSFIVGKI
jgi:hypothetical protein